ncbi:hypothetical protein GCM10009868_31310 [Terrabacter aerolatus]|uniref:DUF304 domain-containing protein n=1 Tax=Terrabacter aerolatus TaxID=422442 RepID=A0A512CYY4_9MICO|nr:hypothetical protein [Terrabacter aerolatus]GEO29425.1 hypothetical protein TAE01_12350 [Terrabacter aerolatus]
MTLPHRPGLLGTVRPAAGTGAQVVRTWRPPWRRRMFVIRLLEAAALVTLYLGPTDQARPSDLRFIHLTLGVLVAAHAVTELRTRVMADGGGLVIVHAFRRTRVLWKDVVEVRPGSRGFGAGWVEVVTTRVVRVPVAADTCPEVRKLWEQATGPVRHQVSYS